MMGLSIGSPPQVRGKLKCLIVFDAAPGITPAGAGKTSSLLLPAVKPWDHPRRCGENTVALAGEIVTLGSPPQVRGKLGEPQDAACNLRITPAGAGKTDFSVDRRHNVTGSPPQVRGKPFLKNFVIKEHRITPAGAGKTLKRSFRNQPFCSGAVQISFNFSNSLNVSLQSGSAR